jgi:FKBP-type peptidyl-prolyl cis-trans isomerase SlyD
MKIDKDSVVTLKYTVHDDAGKLVDQGTEPLTYLHGGYDGIFPLVEQALAGKQEGEKIQLKLLPDDAFGEYDAELVRVEPRDRFPKEIKVGMQFEGAAEDDDEDLLIFTVTDIADDKVVVDGNHPLAGVALTFDATVVNVRAATAEEISHGHIHGEGGHHHH